MHKDTLKGHAKDAAGAIKKHAGRHTGDERMEAEGMMDQAEGKVQKSFGKAKEGMRKALKH